MKRSIRLLVVLLMIVTSFRVASQEPEITPVQMQYKEKPNLVIGITQDTRGYIWLADNNFGLFRYDGNQLLHFQNQPGNPNSLISNGLECVAAANDGTIWIGAFTQGLSHYIPATETFVNYTHDSTNTKSIRSNLIRAIAFDSTGGVWIGTASGLDYYDPRTDEFIHHFTDDPDEEFLQKEHIRGLYIDREGILWAGCGSAFSVDGITTGGLFRIDIKNKKIDRYLHSDDENSLIDNRVKAIFEDSKGNFWVGTVGDGLHTMNREKGTFTRHIYDPAHPDKLSRPPQGQVPNVGLDFITSILEDNNGFIWITTFKGGINRYDPEKKTIQHFGVNETGNHHLPRNDYWCGLKASDGQLWMGGWSSRGPDDQLLKIDPSSKKLTKVQLDGPAYHFAEDMGKNIYMSVTGGQIIRLNKSGNYDAILSLADHFTPGTNPRVNNLEIDDDNNLWISSYAGLFQYNLETKKLRSFRSEQKTGLETNNIQATCILNKDSILVGANPGLYLLDLASNRFTKFRSVEYITGNLADVQIIQILADAHQNIWIGTNGDGLQRLDLQTGKSKLYKWDQGSYNRIYQIAENPETGIYVGSMRNGLRHYNATTDQFESLTDNSGLLNKETPVIAVQPGTNNDLWLETVDGIIHYFPKTGNSSIYGSSWGFDINQIQTAGFFLSSDGEYYAGTATGYLKFRPTDFENKNEFRVQPFIGKLLINNESFAGFTGQNEKLNLSYQQNSISIELGYINFLSDPTEQFIQYKLEGYDDAWRSGENAELVNYYKITPGNYQFRLKGMDRYGKWNETTLSILISPPWYKTWLAYIIYAMVLITAIFGFDRFMRRRIVQRERQKAQERELAQAKEIEKAYNELKTTQAQLIQSEKMASLGELTAGIAHEIQNPLNFVNNFSEVNAEMIDEMQQELKAGEIEEAISISNDIKENEQKINHHGKRAESIVKNMLQHSRSSSGVKEPTDINALCDEYLRLSYHGFRAKDKSFNADFKLEADEKLPKIEVVPQDIGRVLLNLINNAFYVVNEKAKNNIDSYKPEVIVKTSLIPPSGGGGALISVSDNGPGIPPEIKDKIFQPFFTTKPTGSGTGLGLSLSYDIVKAHGGKISVNSKEILGSPDDSFERGTEFIIELPIN